MNNWYINLGKTKSHTVSALSTTLIHWPTLSTQVLFAPMYVYTVIWSI